MSKTFKQFVAENLEGDKALHADADAVLKIMKSRKPKAIKTLSGTFKNAFKIQAKDLPKGSIIRQGLKRPLIITILDVDKNFLSRMKTPIAQATIIGDPKDTKNRLYLIRMRKDFFQEIEKHQFLVHELRHIQQYVLSAPHATDGRKKGDHYNKYFTSDIEIEAFATEVQSAIRKDESAVPSLLKHAAFIDKKRKRRDLPRQNDITSLMDACALYIEQNMKRMRMDDLHMILYDRNPQAVRARKKFFKMLVRYLQDSGIYDEFREGRNNEDV